MRMQTRHRIILFSLITLVTMSINLVSSQRAAAYYCPVFGVHCYGIAQWDGGTLGSYTYIFVNDALGPVNGEISNEMWLDDFYSPQCVSTPWNFCFVEGGIVTTGPGSPIISTPGQYYFVADQTTSASFALQLYLAVDPATKYQYMNTYIIQRSSTTYEVRETAPAGTITYLNFDYYSTGNSMAASTIQVGQELSGDYGGESYLHYFTNNGWYDSGYNFHFQEVDGDGPPPNNPPYAGWYPNESPPQTIGQSPSGGIWYAACGCY